MLHYTAGDPVIVCEDLHEATVQQALLLCTGTEWADKAKLDAQAALQVRYGLKDDVQGWQGLEIVKRHMKVMYALPG